MLIIIIGVKFHIALAGVEGEIILVSKERDCVCHVVLCQCF